MTDAATAGALLLSVADVKTARASRYLVQLAKHFSHKVTATFDAREGLITFPGGACWMEAADGVLRLQLSAPNAADLERLRDLVARHLARFAFREELQIAWRAPAGSVAVG